MSQHLAIRSEQQKYATDVVLKLLTEIHQTVKRNIDGKDLVLDASMLMAEVNQYFPYLTLVELQSVLRQGVRGYYDKEGKVYALSISTFHQWILSYLSSDERLRFVRKMQEEENRNRPQLAQRNEKSPQELRRESVEMAVKKFKNYRASGQLFDYFSLVYNFLDAEGKLRFSSAEKNEAMRKAEDSLRRSKPKKGSSVGDILHAQVDKRNRTIFDAKLLLLKRYFDELIAEGKSLSFE